MEDAIKRFLLVSYGSGYGYGSGSGSGDGDVDGDGSGIKNFNGQSVYYIDGFATIIETVHDNRYAKGYILREDLTFMPTYVARIGNSFAHGDTLKEAVAAATEKWLDDEPIEEKVARFKEEHPDLDTPYGDLFRWHHILTGSCEVGRREWCRSHGYQPTDSITVRTFIEQTRNDFGRDAILAVAEAYGITLKSA